MVETSKGIAIPLNRVEGDLEIRIEVEDGIVVEAWSTGTMFRGFEEMMRGRGSLDGLVVTPRICGICSLTHLTAAVEALDAIAGVTPPDNALRLRNLALMAETLQSDIRQAILMFMVDFANREAYGEHPLFVDAWARYAPLEGRAAIEVIRESKYLMQVVGIIGGQWPHTSFMVPGGVTSIPDISKILQCRTIVERFRSWYERTILGCSIERWREVQGIDDLDAWLTEKTSHQESEVGFFTRFSHATKLSTLGKGPDRFLSYGGFPLPRKTSIQSDGDTLIPSGWAVDTAVFPFEQAKITEDVSHSWFEQENGPLHPYEGKTKPYASGQSGQLYSWVKAPRYDGEAAETGPLAEAVVGGNPLFKEMVGRDGANAFSRELARLVRPAFLLDSMKILLDELQERRDESFYTPVKGIPDGQGAGLIQAARGALGHWVRVEDEKITHYQVVTPTAWNGSPRDARGVRGAWEEALIGTPIKDIGNPVEAGHVIRSFDPCLVCAVHCHVKGKK